MYIARYVRYFVKVQNAERQNVEICSKNIPLKICMHIRTEVMDEKRMQQKARMYNFESTILQSGEKLIDNN
jgi:hypothetical protein